MFVYCNLVSDQIIGDKKVPLLRAVQVDGKHGDIITKTYQTLYTFLLVSNISKRLKWI